MRTESPGVNPSNGLAYMLIGLGEVKASGSLCGFLAPDMKEAKDPADWTKRAMATMETYGFGTEKQRKDIADNGEKVLQLWVKVSSIP